jgi:hypothetical protein
MHNAFLHSTADTGYMVGQDTKKEKKKKKVVVPSWYEKCEKCIAKGVHQGRVLECVILSRLW